MRMFRCLLKIGDGSYWIIENTGLLLQILFQVRFLSFVSFKSVDINYRWIYRYRPFYTNLVRPLRVDDTIQRLEQLPYMELEHGGDGYSSVSYFNTFIQVQTRNRWDVKWVSSPAPPGDSSLPDHELWLVSTDPLHTTERLWSGGAHTVVDVERVFRTGLWIRSGRR